MKNQLAKCLQYELAMLGSSYLKSKNVYTKRVLWNEISCYLPTIGIEVSTLEAYPSPMKHTYEWPNQKAYSKLLKKDRGLELEEGVSIQEEMFLLYLQMPRFVCNQSVQIQKRFQQ